MNTIKTTMDRAPTKSPDCKIGNCLFAKNKARLVLSYLVIFATNLLGSLLLRLTNEATTNNQSILNGLVQNSSLISTFFLLVLIAPICEEILCRGIIPKKIFRGKEKLGFVVGANSSINNYRR